MRLSKRRLLAAGMLIVMMGGAGILLNYLSLNLVYANSDAKAASVDRSIVAANTGFAIGLLKELQGEQTGRNTFISPLSVSIALAMAYNGANSSTREAMGRALGLDGMSDDAINVGYQRLIESLLSADRDVSLNIGDSVWIRSTFAPAVNAEFTDALSKYFGSSIYSRPFDASTVDEVNSWVSKETNGKIDKILESIDSHNVMFLINAIYFKGGWVDEFDAALTQQADFTTADGSVVKVDIMSREGGYSYYGDEAVQVIRLPYGRDKIAMYVFLPAEGSSLESFVSGLTRDSLETYLGRLTNVEIELQLPKLKLEYGKTDLKDALTALGMGIAFDSGSADFGRIADVRPEHLYLAFVDHKAMIEVNEEGTEAAAATNVGISLTSLPVMAAFIVNRPYMFIIRDDRSGTILFSGLITDPTVKASP
jgi:serine protease inhibitor